MKCPGQDTRYWKPGAVFEVKCPKCGEPVEFFKDDPTRKCGNCGHRFLNPSLDFGCASYCPYAEQCIGKLPPELMAQREDLLKDRVAIEMKRYFQKDFKRVGHAVRVARYAEQLGRKEGGNLAVIMCAAYLHDIGMKNAEQKYGNYALEHHEKEGPSVARETLKRLGAKKELIEKVCQIISHHHHPGEKEAVNFKVVYDADRLADMEERTKKDGINPENLRKEIEGSLFTKSGKDLAKKFFLSGN